MDDDIKAKAQVIWKELSGAEKDVIIQLKKVTWDGNLSSKTGRDGLVKRGFAMRYNGYQSLTYSGLQFLCNLGKLEDLTR